jgi:hypothetical protein
MFNKSGNIFLQQWRLHCFTFLICIIGVIIFKNFESIKYISKFSEKKYNLAGLFQVESLTNTAPDPAK